jgi:glycerophosphoryl diester phosphodiesterase
MNCEQAAEVTIPMFPDGGLLREGTALTRKQLMSFEGMFNVEQGRDLLGDTTSVRTSPGTVSLLTDKDAGFAVLSAACLTDYEKPDPDADEVLVQRVVVEGYWQYPTRTEAGLVRLFVQPKAVAEAFCNGEEPAPTTDFSLEGTYGEDNNFPTVPLALRYAHELKEWRRRFFTVAHHGACENTDHCGASPNSLETIRLAERVGSNAAELDVRMTRDGIPILFHDPGMSRTLVRGLFCNGQVADMSLAEIRANCLMRYGEQIPTLEEALRMMVEETELEGVYLDEKTPEGVLPSARLAADFIAELARRNSDADPSNDRQFVPIVALPTEETLAAWHTAKVALAEEGREIPPCLIEYDPNMVVSEGCQAWGPTWTEGPQPEGVQTVRADGGITIFWTINQSEFINEFLTVGQPDGIITARASLLFHRYQQIGITPPVRPGAGQ